MKKKKGIMGDLFDNYDDVKKSKDKEAKKAERKKKREKFIKWIKENPEAAYGVVTSVLATSTAIIIKITNTVHKVNEEKRENERIELRRMEQERLEAQRLEAQCDIYDRKDNMHYTTKRPLTNREKNDIKVRQQNTGERMYDILEEMGVLK